MSKKHSILSNSEYLLALTALFETYFSIDWIVEISGMKASIVLETLDQGVEEGLLVKKGPAVFAFIKKKRNAWVKRLTPEISKHLNGQIGKLLIRELPDNEEKPLVLASYLLNQSNDLEKCKLLYRAGELYANSYLPLKAIDCFNRILIDLKDKSGKEEDLLYIKSAIASSNCTLRRGKVQIESFEEALKRAKRTRKNTYIPLIKMHIAKLERYRSGYTDSIKKFEQASRMYTETDDPEIITNTTSLNCYFFFLKGNFQKVVDIYEEAMPDIHKSPIGYFPVFSAVTVAHCYASVGLITQSLGLLHSLRNYCLENNDYFMGSEVSMTVAWVLLSIQRFDDALKLLKQSLKESEESGNVQVSDVINLMYILIYYHKKDKKRTIKYLDRFAASELREPVLILCMPFRIEICYLMEIGELPRRDGFSIEDEIESMLGIKNLLIKGLAYRYKALVGVLRNHPSQKIIKAFSISKKLIGQSGGRLEHAKSLLEFSRYYLSIDDEKRAKMNTMAAAQTLTPQTLHLIPSDLAPMLEGTNNEGSIFSEISSMIEHCTSKAGKKNSLNKIITIANRVLGAERGVFIMCSSEERSAGLQIRTSINFTIDQLSYPSFAPAKSMIESVIATGRGQVFKPESSEIIFESRETIGSAICVPIRLNDEIIGVLYHDNRLLSNVFKESDLSLLDFFSHFVSLILDREDAYFTIKEIQNEKSNSIRKNKAELFKDAPNGIIGTSKAILKVQDQIDQVAKTDAVVLLLGETGVGKNLIARAIHNKSNRSSREFHEINCAALAPNLFESELFGHERGAFTGADKLRKGRFETARGSTLFLDEISELSLKLQPKLLRVIQTGEFERVGGSAPLRADVRLIAATNKDLAKEISSGKFREDLWYRLNIFPIQIPPLRERTEDILLLVNWFIAKYNEKIGKQTFWINPKELSNIQHYAWPGNVRELENLVERAIITSPDGEIKIEVPSQKTSLDTKQMTFKEYERKIIIDTLKSTFWKIEGPNGAAQRLDIHPSTLRSRMRKLSIRKEALSVEVQI